MSNSSRAAAAKGEPGAARSLAADPEADFDTWRLLMRGREVLEITVAQWRDTGAWRWSRKNAAAYEEAQRDLAEYRAAAAEVGAKLGVA